MLRTRTILLLIGTCMIILSVSKNTYGKPQRSHATRRSITENPSNEDVLSAPFAPGSSRDNAFSGNEKPQSASNWHDQTGEGSEDSMAAPNFHSSKTMWNRNSFRNSAVIRSSSNSRMGPHHQKQAALKDVKNHKRRSFFNSKEGLISPSKLAATIDSVSKNIIASTSNGKSKHTQEKIEVLPTPLPAAAPRPARNASSTTSKVKTVTLRKRSESKVTHEENRRLMKELGAILKDDDKEDAKRIPPDVKRQAIAEDNVETVSDGSNSDSSSKNTGIMRSGSKGSKSDRKAFNDWLRNEYFRNMALSMSTAKRKRDSPIPFEATNDMRRKRKVDFDFDEQEFDSDNNDDDFEEEKTTHSVVQENVKAVLPSDFDPETVQRRLQSLENAVLTEAVEKIVERARESAMAEAARDQVAQRLAEAFYLEKLQQAIEDKFAKPNSVSYRPKKMQKTQFRETTEEEEPSDDNEESWSDANQDDDIDDEGPIKRGNGNLAEALSGMSTDTKRRLEHVDCPELRLITSDCSSLDDILPPDTTVSPELKHTCNKHEVCYTCGEAFGLSASICDVQFLRETAQICSMEGDKCEPHDLTKILAPLRERRVFYKRSINPICYRAHICIGRFLTEP